MRKRIFQFLLLILFSSFSYSANLTAINFQQKGELSYLDLLFDEESVAVEKYQVVDDKQIILDIKNVEATDRVMRAFDTSEFSGSVVFVSAYKKPDSPKDVRVVLQLRDNVRTKLAKIGKRAVLTLENRFGVFSQNQIQKDDEIQSNVTIKKVAKKLLIPKSRKITDILENLTLSGKKKYIGKRITINVKSMPVGAIIEMIADASGFNIIQTNEVKKLKPLSLNLINIPWDQVLDTVLTINKLVAEKNGSILTIKSLKQATRETQDQLEANKLKQKEEPLVTKIFPVSYADGKELSVILKDYLTKNRGAISLDVRTNSIIVKDTLTVIEKVKKILEFLDTQTPQVLIESKIVEVFENYSKSIGLVSGLNFGYDPIGTQADASSIVGNTPANTEVGGPGFSFSSAPTGGDTARNVLGLTVGRFGRLFNLGFQLQLLESEAKGKIVASPKVVTKHNVKASLTAEEDTSYTKREGTGADATVSFEILTSTLQLDVTPRVTNDGSIDLEIELQKEQFGIRPSADAPPNKSKRKIKTNVLIENGSTIVLGGLYNYQKTEVHSGVPFLKDIPLIGWLFRTPYAPETQKQELVIFITPRIINQEEAGLVKNI